MRDLSVNGNYFFRNAYFFNTKPQLKYFALIITDLLLMTPVTRACDPFLFQSNKKLLEISEMTCTGLMQFSMEIQVRCYTAIITVYGSKSRNPKAHLPHCFQPASCKGFHPCFTGPTIQSLQIVFMLPGGRHASPILSVLLWDG